MVFTILGRSSAHRGCEALLFISPHFRATHRALHKPSNPLHTLLGMMQTATGTVQNDDDGPRPGQQIIDVILPNYIMKPAETEM